MIDHKVTQIDMSSSGREADWGGVSCDEGNARDEVKEQVL